MKNIVFASLLFVCGVAVADGNPKDPKKDPEVVLVGKDSYEVFADNARGWADVLKGLAGLSLFSKDSGLALKDLSVAVFVASLCATASKKFALKKGLFNKNGFNGAYIASGVLFCALSAARAAMLLHESHNKPVSA